MQTYTQSIVLFEDQDSPNKLSQGLLLNVTTL